MQLPAAVIWLPGGPSRGAVAPCLTSINARVLQRFMPGYVDIDRDPSSLSPKMAEVLEQCRRTLMVSVQGRQPAGRWPADAAYSQAWSPSLQTMMACHGQVYGVPSESVPP